MPLGSKYLAYTSGLVGVALLIGGLSTGNFSNGSLPLKEDTAPKESYATRFAKGFGSHRANIVKEVHNNFKDESHIAADETQERASMAKMRNLKLSQKELKEQKGNGTGARNPNRQSANGPNANRQSGNGQNVNRNGNRQNDNRQGADNEPSVNNRRNGNRQNGNQPELMANTMQMNRGGRDKDSNSNQLRERIDDESIAETMTRLQLKLRPESNQMKKNTEQLSGDENPFPFRYPKIRYVPWGTLTDDTKDILAAFDYTEGSWNYRSDIIESKAFSKLNKNQQKSALMLGIDENVWDCFINHYSAYSRKHLVELGLDEYDTALSEVQSKPWDELSKGEKQAATKLCYFKEVWNKETLGTW